MSHWVKIHETLILKELSAEDEEGWEDEFLEWSHNPKTLVNEVEAMGRFLFVMPSPRSGRRFAKAFLRKRWRGVCVET